MAVAADLDHRVRAAFRTRLEPEQNPIVHAALIFGTAEATRAHPHEPASVWMTERWRNRTEAP
ncbi:hypothetical protein [Streptomyces tsukubensis]|uniref:hypothetical protein n=1 Tax=Streptomyces tsukubensis TaxID=83656 RepID=UPI00344CE8B0